MWSTPCRCRFKLANVVEVSKGRSSKRVKAVSVWAERGRVIRGPIGEMLGDPSTLVVVTIDSKIMTAPS